MHEPSDVWDLPERAAVVLDGLEEERVIAELAQVDDRVHEGSTALLKSLAVQWKDDCTAATYMS